MTRRSQPTSRHCFLCGRDNPVGLKMRWETRHDTGEVRGTVTVPEHFNGYPGVVHGGIVAAILDETAGRAVLLSGDDEDLMMTLKLEVSYRRPTPTATPLTAVGRIRRRTERRAVVEGELLLPDGTVAADCTAVVVKPPEGVAAAWEKEKAFWKID